MVPKAIWNGHVIAEAGWKGTASYLDLVDGDQVAPNAVWTYRGPKPAAAIEARCGFGSGTGKGGAASGNSRIRAATGRPDVRLRQMVRRIMFLQTGILASLIGWFVS